VTTTEERQELLAIAKALDAQLRDVRDQMNEIKRAVSLTVCKLIGTSNELKIISADEISAGESVTVKKLTVRPKGKLVASSTVQSAAAALAAADAAKKAKPKRKRKPLTPEEKTILVARLAKARAKKGTLLHSGQR